MSWRLPATIAFGHLSLVALCTWSLEVCPCDLGRLGATQRDHTSATCCSSAAAAGHTSTDGLTKARSSHASVGACAKYGKALSQGDPAPDLIHIAHVVPGLAPAQRPRLGCSDSAARPGLALLQSTSPPDRLALTQRWLI